MKCFVGLDVRSTKLDVCIMTKDTEFGVLFSASLTNDLSGASEIKKQVLELNERYLFNRIVIGMEATSLYSFHPAMFFNNDSDLKKLNTEVMIEQPNKIKKYREAFEENKNEDVVDSKLPISSPKRLKLPLEGVTDCLSSNKILSILFLAYWLVK